MFYSIEGKIVQKYDKFLVLEANGIGYKIFISRETLSKMPQLGNSVKLFCSLEVRENAQDLFGFLSRDELDFYEILRTVSGVGPKSALSILALAPVRLIASSISQENISFLSKVSGIGRKTAEKIILELKDKVKFMSGGSQVGSEDGDILEALTGMGYAMRDATHALEHLPKDLKDTTSRLKEALKILGKK